MNELKVAIVHDWLEVVGGAERVLAEMFELWPQAELYTLVDFLGDADRALLKGKRAHTSFIQRLPGARKRFRSYLPLMPLAIEQFDLSQYDLIISSSYAVAKGVLTHPDQVHVSYVHSPMRYAWDLQQQYLRESGLDRGIKGNVVRVLMHGIRQWDFASASRPDALLANSRFIQRRIEKVYRRDSRVLHPPVDLDRHQFVGQKKDFYLTASRLVPYKCVSAIVAAFASMPDRELVVIGAGPELPKINAMATSNVRVLGYQSDEVLTEHLQNARAFIFAAMEDFGIVPVEAQACGTPVIALGRGGVLDSVRPLGEPNPSGLYFDRQTPEAIRDAVVRFESEGQVIRPEDCRRSAERFSPLAFRAQLAHEICEIVSRRTQSGRRIRPDAALVERARAAGAIGLPPVQIDVDDEVDREPDREPHRESNRESNREGDPRETLIRRMPA